MTMPATLASADPMRVFGHVRASEVRSLASPALEVVVPAGTELVKEGEEMGTFFVVRSGTATISRHGRPVRELGPGDCFGESDPISPAPQPFTIVASSKLRLLAFSSFGIARLCAAIPSARENILRYLGQAPPPERSLSALGSSTVIAR